MAKSIPKPQGVETATDRAPQDGARPATVAEPEIARRASDLYLARGREDGHDLEDWLQAEHELNGGTKSVR